jgi:predicted nucleic acid-binding protein
LETVNGLSRRADRSRVPVLFRSIRGNSVYEVVPATSELFEAGLVLHGQRADKDWSLTDCTSFVVMQRRGITRALTPDHHFEQAGFEALLRRDPP